MQFARGPDPPSSPRARLRSRLTRCAAWLACLLAPVLFACVAPARNLEELIIQDSTYLDPVSMLPYSGRVIRHFQGEDSLLQLEATLRGGTWEGELTVYHESGRVRYQGEMSGGAQCGGWIENENATEPETVYQAITEDLESLVIYPECPDG